MSTLFNNPLISRPGVLTGNRFGRPPERPGLLKTPMSPFDDEVARTMDMGVSKEEATKLANAPHIFPGWNGGGGGGGRYGRRWGGYGYNGGDRSRIGSAAGAVGSGGVPTSQRGRLEKIGADAASMPTWEVSRQLENGDGTIGSGGLSQSQRYSAMGGLPPPPSADEATAQPVPDSSGFGSGVTVRRNPDGSVSGTPNWNIGSYARGTGRGRPIPHGQPFIAGDSKDGKPNEEIILPTREGVHVIPTKKLSKFGEGTRSVSVRPMGQAANPRVRRTNKPPVNGLNEFYEMNPGTPTALESENAKLETHPEVPMPIRLPQFVSALPKYADGTEDSPHYAIDEFGGDFGDTVGTQAVNGASTPKHGEIRQDAQGNDWRYDATLGRGIPLNPYLLNPRAAAIDSFHATPAQRYNDLAMRLSGLRQEGMAQARADVAALKAEQDAVPKSDLHATGFDHGGVQYRGRYGTATIGANVPKSFNVERLDGTTGRFNNVADAGAESRADAAQRHAEGIPMNTGRGVGGAGAPTAIEELAGVIEPSAVRPVASAYDRAHTFHPLPDDLPSTVASRRRAWGMRPRVSPTSMEKAASRGKDAAVRRSADFGTNLQTAIDLGLVKPARDFTNNASTAWDILTQ